MADQKQTTFSIEELNKQFQQQYEAPDKGDRKTKKQFRIRKSRLLAVVIFLVILAVGISAILQGGRRPGSSNKLTAYSVASSESEYQKQYESVNMANAFIGVNEVINVSDRYAHVGLVNAVGGDSLIAIKIYDKETETVFYQSEKVCPGTVLHIAVLDEPIINEDNAVLDYIVYDPEGNELGVYPAGIKFEVVNDTNEEVDDGRD